jgi:hypothetical protein
MDVVVGAVIGTGTLALLAAISVLVLRGPLRFRLRGPGDTGLDLEGTPLAAGVRLRRVRAGRNLRVTGQQVDASGIRAGQDVTFEDRGEKQTAPPKG